MRATATNAATTKAAEAAFSKPFNAYDIRDKSTYTTLNTGVAATREPVVFIIVV